jgi:DNA-binding transcriptional LysR family regulator
MTSKCPADITSANRASQERRDDCAGRNRHAIAALEEALAIELFERDVRKATVTAAGRSLLPDARAVIARTEEMKTRARSVAKLGAPHLSIAVDVYFPRETLVGCLRALQSGPRQRQSTCG